jgi:hypothetical protein
MDFNIPTAQECREKVKKIENKMKKIKNKTLYSLLDNFFNDFNSRLEIAVNNTNTSLRMIYKDIIIYVDDKTKINEIFENFRNEVVSQLANQGFLVSEACFINQTSRSIDDGSSYEARGTFVVDVNWFKSIGDTALDIFKKCRNEIVSKLTNQGFLVSQARFENLLDRVTSLLLQHDSLYKASGTFLVDVNWNNCVKDEILEKFRNEVVLQLTNQGFIVSEARFENERDDSGTFLANIIWNKNIDTK